MLPSCHCGDRFIPAISSGLPLMSFRLSDAVLLLLFSIRCVDLGAVPPEQGGMGHPDVVCHPHWHGRAAQRHGRHLPLLRQRRRRPHEPQPGVAGRLGPALRGLLRHALRLRQPNGPRCSSVQVMSSTAACSSGFDLRTLNRGLGGGGGGGGGGDLGIW